MAAFFRILKNFIVTVMVIAVIGMIGGIIYLNQIGFPGKYGEWVRTELKERGLQIEFQSLRFSPRHGLIATEAEFFAQPGDEHPALTADYISIDIDKSFAIRGKFELRDIKIIGGTTYLPMQEGDEVLKAEDINATIFIQEDQRIRVRDATGMIEGVNIKLTADLKLPKRDEIKPPEERGRSDHILRAILKELERWKIPADSPPELTFVLRGDLADPGGIHTEFDLEANDLVRNDYALGTFSLHGDLRSQLVTIDRILLADDTGEAEGQADWDLLKKSGRFDLSSNLRIKDFLKSCFGIEVMTKLDQEESPDIKVEGTIFQRDDQSISVKAMGQAFIGPFRFLDTTYTGLTSDFSWHDGDLFLQDLNMKHEKGAITGDFLMKGDDIRYRLRSNLPLTAFSPVIVEDSTTEKLLSRFLFMDDSVLALEVEGRMKRSDKRKWSASGRVHSTALSYRDISMHQLRSNFEITEEKIEFSQVEAIINDDAEEVRRRYGGSTSQPILTDLINIDRKSRVTTVSNLRGTFWPSPIVRAFAPKVATHLAKNYRFHEPPTLTLNGAFTGKREQPQDTAFNLMIRTKGKTDYPFLGRILPTTQMRADVTMRGLDLEIDRLAFATLEGVTGGRVTVQIDPQMTRYQGEMQFDRISFPELSKVYKFDNVEQGTLAGKITFSGGGGNIRNFNARGSIGLKQGNLVSLPVLGPLSPLMAGVLGNKRAGYERAKDASASFIVKNGVWQSEDIVAESSSVVLTGDGWIDLATKKMDMTIRVNARGLLGIIAIPLTPFKGLFQFRGTGLFTDSNWEMSPFTKPRNGTGDVIFEKPRR
ncbi:AsmA-like C-terminal region-containing protein [Akkermansiaceae bacterium]|nr:AsmA-like C-terminal region-containing protein [Akkermansiaceae bacterium]MDB4421740.1 AsmA-like C-terminal region-containing protein [Akkermansiaceae bacterium]MDB4462601.1 AsmA-like C-terminal region-containing protein [Akkermansiaceae bacterium]MDB4546256.1 AsmA-like C-terminal region-containing protein [Akkermansiaceae bacterium]MDB4578724.1 AsmA-like C-terminal region-containing protein [Akkermansiaceae bacterium]